MAAMTRRSTFQSLCKKLSLVSIFKTGFHRSNVQKSTIQNFDHSTSKARKISGLESSYDTGTNSNNLTWHYLQHLTLVLVIFQDKPQNSCLVITYYPVNKCLKSYDSKFNLISKYSRHFQFFLMNIIIFYSSFHLSFILHVDTKVRWHRSKEPHWHVLCVQRSLYPIVL